MSQADVIDKMRNSSSTARENTDRGILWKELIYIDVTRTGGDVMTSSYLASDDWVMSEWHVCFDDGGDKDVFWWFEESADRGRG